VAGKDHLTAACSSHDWIEKKDFIRFPPVCGALGISTLNCKPVSKNPKTRASAQNDAETKTTEVFSGLFSPLWSSSLIAQDFALIAP
jgi:hypothetical protein